jgi:hypothetical protein
MIISRKEIVVTKIIISSENKKKSDLMTKSQHFFYKLQLLDAELQKLLFERTAKTK